MKTYFTLLSIALLSTFACRNTSSGQKEGVTGFDISNNDSTLLFSYWKNGSSSIYNATIDGKNPVRIIPQPEDSLSVYVSPEYSPSGDSIIYLNFVAGNTYSNIYIANRDGKNSKPVTSSKSLILEAIFSKDGKGVFYTMAEVYGNYSPAAREAPHSIDIYFIDLRTLERKKLTNFNAYSLDGLNLIEGGNWLAFRLMGEAPGLYKLSLTNLSDIVPMNPVNDPRGSSDMYYELVYSDEFHQFSFIAPYELYIMNPQTMKGEFIFRPDVDQIDDIKMYHKEKKILFLNNDTIRSVSYLGGEYRKIEIDIE